MDANETFPILCVEPQNVETPTSVLESSGEGESGIIIFLAIAVGIGGELLLVI